jgi:hypothetical protein
MRRTAVTTPPTANTSAANNVSRRRRGRRCSGATARTSLEAALASIMRE